MVAAERLPCYHNEGADGLVSAGIDWWAATFGNLQGMMGTTSLLAIGLGGALLIVTRIASWRLILGQLLGLVLVATVCNLFGGEEGITTLSWYWHVTAWQFRVRRRVPRDGSGQLCFDQCGALGAGTSSSARWS